MKKKILGFLAALSLIPIVVAAINITVPAAPGANYVLLSTTTGAYNYVATSSLGISGGGGGITTFGAQYSPGQTGSTQTVASSTSGVPFSISSGSNITTFHFPALPLIGSNGGTGQSTNAIGDLLIGGASNIWNKLSDVAAGSYLRSGGVTTAPLWSTLTLPNTSSQGDLFYSSASNAMTNLAKNTSATRYLANTGTSNNPAWDTINATNGLKSGTYVPLTNGGDGFTNQYSSYNLGSGPVRTDNLSLVALSNYIGIVQAAGGDGITGVVAPVLAGQKLTFQNESINPYFFYNQNSNSIGANQFKFPDGANFTLAPGAMITFLYNQPDAAWEPMSTYPCYPDYYLSGSQLGCITASDYTYWNGKQNAISGTNNAVQYWNGGLTSDATNFFWNFNDHLLGIGTNSPQAGVDVYGANLTLDTPTLSASLYQIPSTDPVNSLVLNQYPEGSGGYSSSGQYFDYDTISEFDVAGTYFYLPPQDQNYTDSSGYSSFYNQLNWSLSTTPDALFVQQNSPSSILEQIYQGSASFADNNDMSPSGSLGVPFSGYVANGSNLNITYTCWAYRTVGATTIYSGSPATYTTTDPNDGNTYMPVPGCGGVAGATGYKIERSTDSAFITTTSGSAVDSPSISWSASSTITPTSITTPAISAHGDINSTTVINSPTAYFSNAAAYSGQAMCYATGGQIGHCTSVVGVGGACTCVAN